MDLLFDNEEKRMKLRKENKTMRHAVELPDTLYTLFFLFNGMFLLFNKKYSSIKVTILSCERKVGKTTFFYFFHLSTVNQSVFLKLNVDTCTVY